MALRFLPSRTSVSRSDRHRGIRSILAIGFAAALATIAPDASPSDDTRLTATGICRLAGSDLRFDIGPGGTLAVSFEDAPRRFVTLSPRRFGAATWMDEADALVEPSFACGPGGLEQRLEVRPRSGAPRTVVLEFELSPDAIPKVSEDGRSIRFEGRDGNPTFVSRDLSAVDAAGREVGAGWESLATASGGRMLRLVLATEDHAPPVSVSSRFAPRKAARRPDPSSELASPAVTAPANDTCAGAATISGSGPFPFLSPIVDLAGATDDGDPAGPACQPDVSHGVWFRFTPALDGDYSFSVCSDEPTATSVEDTVLALYTEDAPCAAPAAIAGACSDDACGAAGLQSRLDAVPLTAGRTYAVLVWIYGTADPLPGSSEVQLLVNRLPPAVPPPANDRCESAEIIPPAGPFPYLTSVVSDISGATTAGDPPLPSCQPNVSRSVWYRFVPAAGGRYVFSACADAPTGTTVDDTVVGVYAAGVACTGQTELAGGCDDDSCSGEPAQSRAGPVDLAAGAAYDVVVWKYGLSAPASGSTAVQLRVEPVTAPANDTCAQAAILPLERPAAGTTAAAGDDLRLPAGTSCYAGPGQTASIGSGRDVVYRFTPPESGRFSFRVTAQAAGNLVVYAGAACPSGGPPATLTGCLAAANRSVSQPEEIDCLGLAAGSSILVIVDEDAATAGGVPFTIEANRCAPEIEPNGAPAAAGTTACLLEGAIVPAGDADFFALGAPPASSRVFAIVDGAAAGSADFDLRVTTVADTLEYDDLNNDSLFGTNSPNVSGTPLTGAPSFLRVSHYSAVAQSQPYRLCSTVRPPASQAAAETEPNDATAAATPLPGGYASGTLASPADVDLFAFDAAAGDLLQVGLDLDPQRNGTPFNGSLAILDGGGASLLAVNDASGAASTLSGAGSLTAASPSSPGEALLYRVATAGTYLARVGFSSGTPGDYLLSIARHASAGAADGDGDGIADLEDCAPADPAAWAPPGEATDLRFADTSGALLSWLPPAAPGGLSPRYDLLRSTRKDDWQGAVCLLSGTSATTWSDPANPPVAFYYLVRSRNACGSNSGSGSNGVPRSLPACP